MLSWRGFCLSVSVCHSRRCIVQKLPDESWCRYCNVKKRKLKNLTKSENFTHFEINWWCCPYSQKLRSIVTLMDCRETWNWHCAPSPRWYSQALDRALTNCEDGPLSVNSCSAEFGTSCVAHVFADCAVHSAWMTCAWPESHHWSHVKC